LRRLIVALALALAASASSPSLALANPPEDAPPPWGGFILCIEGYHPLTHPVFASWHDLLCVRDH